VYRELTVCVALGIYVALNYVAKVNSYSSGEQATVDLYRVFNLKVDHILI